MSARRFCSMLLLLSTLVGGNVTAHAQPRTQAADCNVQNMRRVIVPVDYGWPGGPQLELAFAMRPPTDPSRPLAIVLPGDFTGMLMNDHAKGLPGGLPDPFGAIVVQPRGSGCNVAAVLNEDRYLSSEQIARDTLRIVESLERERGNTPLDYIVYGQSYGTIAATIMASLAPRLGTTPPRALVLEGTIGHSFASFGEHFAGVQAEWLDVREHLPQSWQNFMRKLVEPSSQAWAAVVNDSLRQGFRPDGEHVLQWQLSERGLPTFRAALKRFAIDDVDRAGTGYTRLSIATACAEVFGELYPTLNLRDGELVIEGKGLCYHHERLSRPFDAAAWPFDVPAIYFQGLHDAVTPPRQAHYHFEAQRTAPRYFIAVDEAAQAALTLTLNVGDCPAGLWNAISSDLSQLKTAVTRCNDLEGKAKVMLEYKPGEPKVSAF